MGCMVYFGLLAATDRQRGAAVSSPWRMHHIKTDRQLTTRNLTIQKATRPWIAIEIRLISHPGDCEGNTLACSPAASLSGLAVLHEAIQQHTAAQHPGACCEKIHRFCAKTGLGSFPGTGGRERQARKGSWRGECFPRASDSQSACLL
jgi:hypothetical protein